ncbi:signal peptide peptidase SppA [Enterococcus camelliae]|uniref:Signal peptide peptidase SppA n=1 Tax=Enterococcus camelliae TaxID=453959 RepID=A0ABW5THW9_9ENTE
MNKRRWIGIGIAAALLGVSLVTSGLKKQEKTDKENTLTNMEQLLYGSGQLEESVLEEGNEEKRIVQLTVDGTITDTGESSSLFSTASYNHQQLLNELKEIQKDSTIKGVLLVVNSPGGGVYESAEIAKEIAKVQQKGKRLYVSMKSMAASGGYYISASADKIFATNETITGSIGVISSNLNYSGLLEKLGINDQTYKSGALKDMNSSVRPATEEDKTVMQAYIDSAYNRFVEIVANGRHLPVDTVKKIADGRIYDGSQAVKNGLVDEIGYQDDALKALKKENNLKDAEVFQYNVSATGFASSWLGSSLAEMQGLKQSDSSRIMSIVESIGTPEAPKPMYYYGGE